jgi:hypothetical protein
MTPDQAFVLWFVSLNLRERARDLSPLTLGEMVQVAQVLDHARDHARDQIATIDALLKGLDLC